MSDETLRALTWVGVGVGIVIVFMVLEFVFRVLTNRFGTPQNGYTHRNGTQVPRVQQ
jgi:hypothetical protein